jgi:protein CpxP
VRLEKKTGRLDTTQHNRETTTMTTQTSTIKPQRSRRWGLLLALPLAGALAIPAASALAGQGWHKGGDEAGMFGGFAKRRMARFLDAAGATDAQKAQIKSTWEGLRPQLKTAREEGMKVREELRKALTAQTIDTSAVERLRKQSIALADKTSALVTQGMVASAQVLTPEQRQKVAAEMEKHHGGHDR